MPDREPFDANGETVRRRPGRPSLSNEELLDKALDLFLEKGFAGTSIEAICAAASMAKRTVYARYGDKETLFKAALVRAIEEWIVPTEALRAQEVPDLEETLRRIGTLLVENALSPAGYRLLRLTNAEAMTLPHITTENVRLSTGPTREYLTDLFRRRSGGPEGTFGDPINAADAFFNLIVIGPVSIAGWGVKFDTEAIERHVAYSTHLFLRGAFDRKDANGAEQVRHLLQQAGEGLEQARLNMEQAARLA